MSPAPACEVRPSPIHGQGLFALRPLNPGDLILREPLALSVPKLDPGPNEPANPKDVYAAFQSAPKNVQDAVMKLTETLMPRLARASKRVLLSCAVGVRNTDGRAWSWRNLLTTPLAIRLGSGLR